VTAQAVRKLHTTPLFPPLVPFLDGMATLLGNFAATGILPAGLSARLNDVLGAVSPVCRPGPEDIVSSHNDLNPNNILFAGDRAWFVDWESAFSADRYVDLATISIFFGEDEADRERMLAAYFGRPSVAAERARLELMRQVIRIFYGVMLLSAVKREDATFALSQDAFARAATMSRPVGVATPEAKVGMACALLKRAVEGSQSEAFGWALAHTER
jgi:Ser/Thr protein kinase RdoA (MazF antagonist)